jgi:hypothetical protein
MLDTNTMIGLALLVTIVIGFYQLVRTLKDNNTTIMAACNLMAVPTVKKQDVLGSSTTQTDVNGAGDSKTA